MSLLAATDNFGLRYVLEWVGLLFVALVIWRKVIPPVRRLMDAEGARIRESLEAGDRAREEGERLVSAARERLDQAKKDAEHLLDQARRSAAQLEEEGRRQAEEDAARIIARADIEIDLARARVTSEVAAQVSEVVLQATEKVVRRELDANAQRRLVDEAIQAAESEAVA